MGKVIVKNQITLNGAFEAPSPEDWLELDADSRDATLEQHTGNPIVSGCGELAHTLAQAGLVDEF